jgi:hypothetical protein
MQICPHGKVLINSVGEILHDCKVCYDKLVKDWNRQTAPEKPVDRKPKPRSQP